jgi:uncharacterized protein YndB with AHSA1/START domain
MSEQVTVTREIAAPAADVWALVSDLTRMGEWSPENRGGAWVKGATGPAPGARFKGENQNGDHSWSTDVTVVDCVPGERFSFLVTAGPFKIAEWSYDFEGTPAGCRVTESATERRNWLIKKVGNKISGVADRDDHNRRNMEATLERLGDAFA